MPDIKKKISIIRPTIDTKYHIDFEWWQDTDSNWRIFLFDLLCGHHREFFEDTKDTIKIDAVDAETAQITQVDGLLYTLMHHCAQKEDFIPTNLPLIARVFRVFLSNGNKPLSPNDLAPMVDRPARTILAALSGHRVYKGIRPISNR